MPQSGAAKPVHNRASRWTRATVKFLGVPVRAVCDPVAQVCYPALERHWQERYRKYWPTKFARRMLILDFALLTLVSFLIVVAGITYYILPLFPGVANAHVDVLTPAAITSGARQTYTVSYVNDSAETLSCAKLRVHLPADTTLDSSGVPLDSNDSYCGLGGPAHGLATETATGSFIDFDLGVLEPHARGTVTFDATMFGATGARRAVTAELIYWPEAATVPVRVRSMNVWNIAGSALRLTATPPASLLRGRATTVLFSYENVSETTLPALTLRLTKPDDFVLTGSVPTALPSRRSAWEIGPLAPGESGELRVNGYFAASAANTAAPELMLEAVQNEGPDELIVETLRQNLDPKANGFSLTQDLSDLEARGVAPGDKVIVRLNYANDSDSPIEHLEITLHTDDLLLELAEPEGLVWNEANTPQLALVAPGESGTVQASFRVRRDLGALNTATPQLPLSASAEFYRSDAPTDVIRTDTAPALLQIASALSLEAAALYFTKDGDQLGVGPLPPRVGATTKYRIVLQISNATGDVRDATLTATLAPGVNWTGNYSVTNGEAIDWLPTSSRISWKVGDLTAYDGTVGEYMGASFEVALTPTATMADTTADLITGISLAGTDATTGLKITISHAPITTDLPFDQRAAGKGVIEAE